MSRHRFDQFELDTVAGVLKRDGERVPIQNQPLQLLCLLIERAPAIVSHQDIRQTLWSDGVYVDFEHSIHRSIRKLRELLSDSSDSPRFIENVPRRGYRFVATLNSDTKDRPIPGSEPDHPETIGPAGDPPSSLATERTAPGGSRRSGQLFRYFATGIIVIIVALAGRVLESRATQGTLLRRAVETLPATEASLTIANTGIRNQEAYDLLLRSRALSHDGDANEEAIAMLERAVGLEAGSAELWQTLASRYRYSYEYNRGGLLQYGKAEAAYKKAMSLDQKSVSAATDLVEMRTENGDLNSAFDEAQTLLNRAGDSSAAHFAMSYVLRYAGLLTESAQECEKAVRISPKDHQLRTCAQTFLRLQDYGRAEDFIRLDAGTDWAEGMELLSLVMQGKESEALTRTSPIPGMAAPLLRACVERRGKEDIQKLEHREEHFPISDPEPRFHVALIDAYCGLKDRAVSLLGEAVDRGYCAAPDLKSDPWLLNLRSDPRYAEAARRADACQARFLAHRTAVSH